ncbi:hypothetical protein ABD91_01990 [Lysinibacillus sphaericus]|uniref:hypothetical protein n=1 Tax=Lysinibacillus sphaericus TaxID=1421 RepID=UPI0018CEE96E|nr:hypothetical protein [Lysinibacillus sphaericus]MBG9689693.1 hypothetical protein [Lysinibacillus sphaericus]
MKVIYVYANGEAAANWEAALAIASPADTVVTRVSDINDLSFTESSCLFVEVNEITPEINELNLICKEHNIPTIYVMENVIENLIPLLQQDHVVGCINEHFTLNELSYVMQLNVNY